MQLTVSPVNGENKIHSNLIRVQDFHQNWCQIWVNSALLIVSCWQKIWASKSTLVRPWHVRPSYVKRRIAVKWEKKRESIWAVRSDDKRNKFGERPRCKTWSNASEISKISPWLLSTRWCARYVTHDRRRPVEGVYREERGITEGIAIR